MAKKQLFETNPLADHPMFSGPPKAAAKKTENLEAKQSSQPAKTQKVVVKPKPKTDPLELRKSTFYLTDDIHKNLKLYAVQNDLDISVLVRQVFTDFLKKKGVEI